ncbi:MAG: hypothetical protein CVV45_10995 [Spirochaetae bacterium HGW-Spirochaetae-10]|nr:MAG: hypothetical protein CVV45_10995 [Spirochaetae bacterium HGW-Spirochaetae-10]
MSSEHTTLEIKPVNVLSRYLTVAQMLMLPSIYLSFHYAWNSGAAESLFAFLLVTTPIVATASLLSGIVALIRGKDSRSLEKPDCNRLPLIKVHITSGLFSSSGTLLSLLLQRAMTEKSSVLPFFLALAIYLFGSITFTVTAFLLRLRNRG